MPKLGKHSIDLINRFDYLFWYGDLNYRLDLPLETVLKVVCEEPKENLSTLYEHDQLRAQMLAYNAFGGFKEMDPHFWPTYRFLREDYDENKNRIYNKEKSRIPSWCDRILWRTFPDCDLEPRNYGSVPTVNTSDHVPVFADFVLYSKISPQLLHSVNKPTNTKFATLFFFDLRASLDCVVKDETAQKKTKLPSPMVKFRAPFLKGNSRTEVKMKTDTPDWGTMALEIFDIPNAAYLEINHIILQLISPNSSTKSKVKKSMALGQTVLSLLGTTSGQPKQFEEPILHYGFIVGQIRGSLQIKLN